MLGVAEPISPAQERYAIDRGTVRALLDELDVGPPPQPPTPTPHPLAPTEREFQIGLRGNGRPRPIKGEFGNGHEAGQVLRQARRLRESPVFSHVYIRRSYPNALWKELWECRKSAELGKYFVIYGNTVAERAAQQRRTPVGATQPPCSAQRSEIDNVI